MSAGSRRKGQAESQRRQGSRRLKVEARARLRIPQAAVEFTERDTGRQAEIRAIAQFRNAHGDDKLVGDLLERLRIRTKARRNIASEQWQDKRTSSSAVTGDDSIRRLHAAPGQWLDAAQSSV